MNGRVGRVALIVSLLAVSCTSGVPRPVTIDTANDACHRCRMIASNARLAAQIVTPGEEPLIFDDIGCLRDHLSSTPLAPEAAVYVADHRTGDWLRAANAVYTHTVAVSTPMGSHLIAHVTRLSRDADPASRGGEDIAAAAIVGQPVRAEQRP